jgi:hypothetical protein
MSADLVQDIDAAVQADRRVGIAPLEIRFNLSREPFGTLFMDVSATGKFSPGLDKLIYHYDKCLNRLDDCVEK